jgi:membrane fusion protein, multidrug efflux system
MPNDTVSNDETNQPGQQGPPPDDPSNSGQGDIATQRVAVRKYSLDHLPRWFVPTVVLALAIFVVVMFVNDWNLWDGHRGVETTDDAYARADITPLSTKVAGVVSVVAVTDFQRVKKGELIVQIRNDDFQAKVDQDRAAVNETEKSIEQLKAELEVQDTRIAASEAATLVGNTNITVAATNIQAAGATVDMSQSTLQQAKDAIAQAESDIRADEANAERAMLEKNRQEQLFAERATTKRAVEQIVANADEAAAAIARDKAKRDGARALLAARLADLRRARDIHSNSLRDRRNANDQYTKLEAEHKGHVKEKAVLLAREKSAQCRARTQKGGAQGRPGGLRLYIHPSSR